MSKEQDEDEDEDDDSRVLAREVGLSRYGLISDAVEPSLSTKQRGRLVRVSLDPWVPDYRVGEFAALVRQPLGPVSHSSARAGSSRWPSGPKRRTGPQCESRSCCRARRVRAFAPNFATPFSQLPGSPGAPGRCAADGVRPVRS